MFVIVGETRSLSVARSSIFLSVLFWYSLWCLCFPRLEVYLTSLGKFFIIISFSLIYTDLIINHVIPSQKLYVLPESPFLYFIFWSHQNYWNCKRTEIWSYFFNIFSKSGTYWSARKEWQSSVSTLQKNFCNKVYGVSAYAQICKSTLVKLKWFF